MAARSRAALRVGLVLTLLGAALVTVLAVRQALAARSSLERVRADLTALRDHPPADREAGRRRLDRDRAESAFAARQMHHLAARLVAAVPLLGHSLDAERRVAEAAAASVTAASDLDRATTRLGSAGAVDLQALGRAADTLQASAVRLRPPLRQLRAAPTSVEPGAVARAVRAARDQLGGLDASLDRAAAAARALRGILGGSGTRHVLVVLQNDAEARGTGGLVSTFSTGTASNGRLVLSPFRDVKRVLAEPDRAVAVAAPADYVAHYGRYRANTTLWRNTTMTPDAPTAAQVLARVAARTAGTDPDVVVLLDVPAIAGVVDATAPVSYGGRRLGGEDLERALMVEAYTGGQSDAAQDVRRRGEELAADAALRDLSRAPASLSLLRALGRAVGGRHIALWSARAAEQADLVHAGLAGSVDPHGDDLAMAVTDNLGDSPGVGNKLDYYVQRALNVGLVVRRDSVEVTETLSLANRAPTGLGSYAAGVAHPGRALELVQLACAPDARLLDLTSGGVPVPAELWREDGSRRVVLVADLPRGQTGSWTLRYEVPLHDDRYALRLLPQPLAHPARLSVTVTAAPGVGVRVEGPTGVQPAWDSTATLRLTRAAPSWWERARERVRRFWDEPVRI